MFQDKGWLVQDDKENYYIYAQTMNGQNATSSNTQQSEYPASQESVFILPSPFQSL